MGFDYKKVLLIGSTSGIGAALAETLVQNGVFVIGVGRRKERLEDFVQKHGSSKTDRRVYDVNDTDKASHSTGTLESSGADFQRPNPSSTKSSPPIQTSTSSS